MKDEEAEKDAVQGYDVSQWLNGERDAREGVKHESVNDSYNAGYNFGIWSQEMKAGK